MPSSVKVYCSSLLPFMSPTLLPFAPTAAATACAATADIGAITSPFRRWPLTTSTNRTTPLCGSKYESKTRASNGRFTSPCGGGICWMVASRIYFTPMTCLADVRRASDASTPTSGSICSRARSTSADGKSTLLITGIKVSRPA